MHRQLVQLSESVGSVITFFLFHQDPNCCILNCSNLLICICGSQNRRFWQNSADCYRISSFACDAAEASQGLGQALTVDETCFYRDWSDSGYTPNNFTAFGNPSESDT